MKALVIGPEGTPYEGGCFVFHIWLPLEVGRPRERPSACFARRSLCSSHPSLSQYPNKPPCVSLATTGQGTTRFNPNLYANGKVSCPPPWSTPVLRHGGEAWLSSAWCGLSGVPPQSSSPQRMARGCSCERGLFTFCLLLAFLRARCACRCWELGGVQVGNSVMVSLCDGVCVVCYGHCCLC